MPTTTSWPGIALKKLDTLGLLVIPGLGCCARHPEGHITRQVREQSPDPDKSQKVVDKAVLNTEREVVRLSGDAQYAESFEERSMPSNDNQRETALVSWLIPVDRAQRKKTWLCAAHWGAHCASRWLVPSGHNDARGMTAVRTAQRGEWNKEGR